MRDWSNAFVHLETHQRKAEEAMTMLTAGLADKYRDTLKAQAEEHLCEMLKYTLDALIWLRAQS